MIPVPDRNQQHREYLRKKETAYSLAAIGGILFIVTLCGLCAYGQWMFTDLHEEKVILAKQHVDLSHHFGKAVMAFELYATPAAFLLCVTIAGLWLFLVQAKRAASLPYVPSVTDLPDPLPAEEVLVRGAQEPSAPNETLLRATVFSEETKVDELLQAAPGDLHESPSDLEYREALKAHIRTAFGKALYPGDDYLRGSDQGYGPYDVQRDFMGKNDWHSLDPSFIDQSPDGLASALSFFSDEAFRFYLPAYLLADIDGLLEYADPVFHLTHGLEDMRRSQLIYPGRSHETWFDYRRTCFAHFTREEAAAIVAYLEFKRDAGHDRYIEQALANYWRGRAV
jgi:hypothetical protein